MASRDRTRRAIVDAFNQLIARRNFNTITVSMICETADIGKATFYRYYKDKYAVMNENYAFLVQRCASDPSVRGFRDLFCCIFREAHAEFWISIRNSFDSAGYNSLLNFITEYSYRFAEDVVRRNRNGKGFTDAERLQIHVFTSGISTMFQDWTFKRYDLTPEQAADALYDCMPSWIRSCRI